MLYRGVMPAVDSARVYPWWVRGWRGCGRSPAKTKDTSSGDVSAELVSCNCGYCPRHMN